MSANFVAPGTVVEVIAPSGGVVSGTFYRSRPCVVSQWSAPTPALCFR